MSLQRIAVPRLISSVHTPSHFLKVHLMFSHSLHSKFPSFLFIPQVSSQTACMHICPSVPHAPPIFLIWSFDCSSRTYYRKHNLRALPRFIILLAIRIQCEKMSKWYLAKSQKKFRGDCTGSSPVYGNFETLKQKVWGKNCAGFTK